MNPFLAPIARLGARRSVRQQKLSALWNPEHWGAEVSSDGKLQMDGVSLPALVAEHGSPLLAVSRSKLLRDATRFASAARAVFPDAMIACSYKTNCVPGVLQQLHRSGFGAEVISHYELWLAERLGVPGERIVVNGVNKDANGVEKKCSTCGSTTNLCGKRESRERDRGRPFTCILCGEAQNLFSRYLSEVVSEESTRKPLPKLLVCSLEGCARLSNPRGDCNSLFIAYDKGQFQTDKEHLFEHYLYDLLLNQSL